MHTLVAISHDFCSVLKSLMYILHCEQFLSVTQYLLTLKLKTINKNKLAERNNKLSLAK